MAIDATTLNDIVLAEHLVGSRLYDQLTTPTSDYDWLRVIAGPRIIVRGTPAEMVIRALEGSYNELAHVNLTVPNNFYKTKHALWEELVANRKSFLTEETQNRIRAGFLANLSVIKNGAKLGNKHKAELLRRGWDLIEFLLTGSLEYTFSEDRVTLLQNLRLSVGTPEAYKPVLDLEKLATDTLAAANEIETSLLNLSLTPHSATFDSKDWLTRVSNLA
jgi:hypothetical protein